MAHKHLFFTKKNKSKMIALKQQKSCLMVLCLALLPILYYEKRQI